MADPNVGTDLDLGPSGFPVHFPVVSGRRNLLLAFFRRVTTDPTTEAGQEIYGGRCMDLRLLVAGRLDPSRRGDIERQISRVAQHDDRIAGTTAKITLNAAAKTLTVTGNLIPSDGSTPFPFVITADAVTAELLDGTA